MSTEDDPLLPHVSIHAPTRKSSFSHLNLSLNPLSSDDDEENEYGDSSKSKSHKYHFEFIGPKTHRNLSLLSAMKEEIKSDFQINFIIVTIPAFFCLFIWRIMNLYGIGLNGGYMNAIYITAITIGPVTFAIFGLIDFFLRYFKLFEKFFVNNGISTRSSNNNGIMSISIQPSIVWAIKSYFAAICETIAYELCNYFLTQYHFTPATVIANAFFGGLGFFGGLLGSGELINLFQFLFYGYNIKDLQSHYTNFGVSFRGFWEGFIFSLIAQLNLYTLLFSGINVTCGKIIDSIIVGLASSLAFSVSGILTSIIGVLFAKKLLIYVNTKMGGHKSALPQWVGLDTVRYDHLLNKVVQGPMFFFDCVSDDEADDEADDTE